MYLSQAKTASLLKKKEINETVLDKYIEVLHGDNIVPNISATYQKKKNAELNNHSRHIYVYERGSQFDILSACPDSFMWVSPLPKEILKRYGLVQRFVIVSKRPIRTFLSIRAITALAMRIRCSLMSLKG